MGWPSSVSKSDLDISWFSGKGAGGQHRNKHMNCCRMVHSPTGIMCTGQSSRDRVSNQTEAFRSLSKKLIPLMRAAVHDRNAVERITERIRTYNYVRGEVIDHRSGRKFKLEPVLGGNLDRVIDSLNENT